MPTKIQFKKSMLAHSMQHSFYTNDINKWLCASVFLSVFTSTHALADENATSETQFISLPIFDKTEDTAKQALQNAAQQQGVADDKMKQLDEKLIEQAAQADAFDSVAMLQQQALNENDQAVFKPIEFEDLQDLPTQTLDSGLANEILRVAEEAKAEAQNQYNSGSGRVPDVDVSNPMQTALTAVEPAPVNVDQLMQNIRADREFTVTENTTGRSLDTKTVQRQQEQKKNFFARTLNKIRPKRMNQAVAIPKISVEVEGASKILAENIKAKLSSFTVESFSDFNSSVPQLRSMSNQAAQAVGYYDVEFKFQKASDDKVKVIVTPNDPVIVREQNIEISGAGEKLPQFQVIKVLPELEPGDILHQGKYEATKTRINEAASNNGFFDAYWRMHDVMLERPENQADINLKYETGSRYKLGEIEFRMSDPSKPLPIKEEILRTLAPWKDGADYTAWRVNALSNNLTNSRYFNYTMVDAVKPEPIVKPLELAPDLQKLVDEQKISEQALMATNKKKVAPTPDEVTQSIADETQFAGVTDASVDPSLSEAEAKAKIQEQETERLQRIAREQQKIPVIVTLNADKLNTVEAGIGYGTDTGVRFRSQYRRAIVNDKGHSFDANLELSQVRQSFDGRYNIPYKHPLNDYFSLVAGYEREDLEGIGNGLKLITESAVAGVDRLIKGSRKEWQHVIGLRYRLDRISINGDLNDDLSDDDIPDAFLAPGANTQQQSLLFGYEATKTISNNRVNPTQGFKQNYKVQLGSKSAMSDADMIITNANWKFLYSLGENNNHQFVGGANLGYIFSNEFDKVPYNLRFLAGGDQSLRGFDYKSLSPRQNGFKIGGQALAVGSLEYNYQFKEGWRAAVFTDIGNAYDDKFSNPTEYSLGFGIRWSSPIGPIRLDVASGVSDPDHPIRLHFFIGPQL